MILKFSFFSAVFLLFSYAVFRIVIRKDYEKQMRLTPISYLLEILVFALHVNLIYLVLPVQWPNFPPFPDNQLLNIGAGVLFGIGVVILLFSWFGLGTQSSLGMDKDKLQTGGLYRYSRNPQLVGYGFMLASFAILYFSWWTILWFLLYLPTSYFMIKSEEEFLERKYGKEYREYCNTVSRIL